MPRQRIRLSALARLVLPLCLIVVFAFSNDASAQRSAGDWAWMGGDNSESSWISPTYGTEYQFAPQNWPGSREESATWTDANGRFWLFGGPGGTLSLLNDLWVFDRARGAHGEWAWMGGSPGTCNFGCSGVYGTEYQFADTNIPGSRSSEAAWVDSTGRLWLFGGSGYDAAGTTGGTSMICGCSIPRGAHTVNGHGWGAAARSLARQMPSIVLGRPFAAQSTSSLPETPREAANPRFHGPIATADSGSSRARSQTDN